MHKIEMTKTDGRRIWLYGRAPVHADEPAPMPAVKPASHRRWHPLAQEWVIYASHRQDRTFLPSDDPLAPTTDPAKPTELPSGDYDVAVFENRFPSMSMDPGPPPPIAGAGALPASGRAEVIVFSRDSIGLSQLPDEHVALILEVMGERTRELIAQGLRYVLPFENRGVEMGVTLHHPHGQIYAYPFLPGRQARALYAQRDYFARHGAPMISDLVASERALGARIIEDRGAALAIAPPFAQFPFETWVLPSRPNVAQLADLRADDRVVLAATLKGVLRRMDALFAKPMPYLMTFNQAPYWPCPEWGLRIEIWPIRRAADKLKYLAGTELGAGVFASDMTPEQSAVALRGAVP